MSGRLYESLDNLCDFLVSLDHVTLLPDADVRRRAAVARYIAEMPASDFFACRKDWRAASVSQGGEQ